MTEAQAHRAAKFDRDYTGSIQYTPLMDCKAYRIVRWAFADPGRYKTCALLTDDLGAMTHVRVTYISWLNSMWRVTVLNVYGEVKSEEDFDAHAAADVVDRVDEILRKAGRA